MDTDFVKSLETLYENNWLIIESLLTFAALWLIKIAITNVRGYFRAENTELGKNLLNMLNDSKVRLCENADGVRYDIGAKDSTGKHPDWISFINTPRVMHKCGLKIVRITKNENERVINDLLSKKDIKDIVVKAKEVKTRLTRESLTGLATV